MNRERHFALLAGVIGLFLALAAGTALSEYTWSNEAWFASPAFTLIHKGYLGTTILESKGTWMEGIDRHTYWIPPLYPLLQSLWYRLTGFGLLQMRTMSILAGCIGLLAWYRIVWLLTASRMIALATILIAATDIRFLIFAQLGRPDVTCAALGVSGWLAYLHWREQRLGRAIAAGNCLTAFSCLTHPFGVLYAAGLLVLTLYYDRRRIGWQHVAGIALPYLGALSAWGIYILQAPAVFVRQFFGNVGGIGAEFTGVNRLAGLTSPLAALKREYFLRYGVPFGRYGSPVERVQLFALAMYTLGVAGCALTPSIRRRPGCRALLLVGALFYAIMGIVDGFKSSGYLVHTLPFCGAFLAIFLPHAFTGWRTAPRRIVAAVTILFAVVQAAGIWGLYTVRENQWDYASTLNFLTRAGAPPQIIGAGEFAFAFGFDSGIVDDYRFGYRSGKRPPFIVANVIYEGVYHQSETRDPELHRYLVRLLTGEYRVAFRNPTYTIYRRIGQ